MKVKRHEDGGESRIYPPQNKDIEHGTTQWFFTDIHGSRRCLATGMLHEKVSMDEGEVGALEARPSITGASGSLVVPNMSLMHLRSTNGGEVRGPKDLSVSEAPGQIRAVQAVYKAAVPSLDLPVTSETVPTGMESYEPMQVLTFGGDTSGEEVETYTVEIRSKVARFKAAGPSLESPMPCETVTTGMGRYELMMVAEAVTPGRDTSVGEVETCPVGVKPKVPHNDRVVTELRALQQQLRITVEKQQEEIKAQAWRARNNDRQAEESLQAREEDRTPIPAWKLLYPRTQRSASQNNKRNRKTALTERERRWDSDVEREEHEVRTDFTKALANVLRLDDPEKAWYTQSEKSGSLQEMRQFHNNDQGALQTTVGDVLQDGAGPTKRERFVVEDGSDRSSRVAATKKVRSEKGNQDVNMKDAEKEGWDVNEECSGN